MTISWITAILETPRSASRDAHEFWLAVTGTQPLAGHDVSGSFAALIPPTGDTYLRTRETNERTTGVQLDLHVTAVRDRLAAATRLGAGIVSDRDAHVVITSPGGLPFRLVEDHGEHTRPQPVTWPGGACSLLDQVCLDIAADRFDQEADFWSELTTWPRHAGSRPEFDYLERPHHVPLRLLLQRIDESGRTRAHLDLACDDVSAETARHRALGAHEVRRETNWTKLRDPAGLLYCITARDPATGTLGQR